LARIPRINTALFYSAEWSPQASGLAPKYSRERLYFGAWPQQPRHILSYTSPFVVDSPDRRNNSAKNMAYFLEWARNRRTFASDLRFIHKFVS
jgi:hypothetical protein